MTSPVHVTKTNLTDVIELHVHLVVGSRYAVWIDSGVKPMFGQLRQLMHDARVAPRDIAFILHTHSHHDHIGCNAQMHELTDCRIAAPRHYAAWHADYERHYQEFARPFPQLVPDTPALRSEVFDILDAPRPLDLFVDEGAAFDLGGVVLRAVSLPGHMLAEVGWFEEATRTLLLGDAITALDWPVFHSHLSAPGYRASLAKIARLLDEWRIAAVYTAHFGALTPDGARALLKRANEYIDGIEATLLEIAGESGAVSLERLWTELCARHERVREFRALNMVAAHVADLCDRGLLRAVAPQQYALC